MEPQVRTAGVVNILEVKGRLTMGSGETEGMGGVIRDLLHAGRKNILLDIGGVAYIDSASLGVLVAHYKRAAERGGVIKLMKPSEKILSLLTLTKLDNLFEIFATEEEALASF